MWEEFKEFALKGNALSLAIGVIIGAAFGKIVDALVNDIIMPILGIAGKADFTNYYVPLSSAVTATNLADARKQGGVLAYGDFITVVINFLIVAIALFAAIKAINIMTRKAAKEPPVPAPPTKEVVLLTEIRDQLAKRGALSAVRSRLLTPPRFPAWRRLAPVSRDPERRLRHEARGKEHGRRRTPGSPPSRRA